MDTLAANTKMDTVQSVYGQAARAPAGLCCPQSYQSELLAHVPAEALERNYGCGSPLLRADVRAGEVVLDLGSGVGIDCFVAAKLVGPKGKVIGVDMTEDMLGQARGFNDQVTRKLGYDVVDFRHGQIEQLPVADSSVDLVISNCVLNLSPKKDEVLKEILRVLRPGGRMVISDIVVDRTIDAEDQDNETLWAECYTGAIPVGALVSTYEGVGFLGLTQLAETPWRELEGYHFGSITLRAFKLPRSSECIYGGHIAVYLGPYASVRDEEDHVFARFEAVEVCDATAQRLRLEPYASAFTVVDVPSLARAASSCGAGGCGTGSSCGTAAACDTSACGAGGCGTAEAEPAAATVSAARSAAPCCDPSDTAAPCCDSNSPKSDGSPCCDVNALEPSAGCGCVATPTGVQSQAAAKAAAAQAAAAVATAKATSTSSSCCDAGAGCGTGCGPSASSAAPAPSAGAAGPACCPCDTEAKTEGTDCCGSGCGECGCS